jgi:hypothetical protein
MMIRDFRDFREWMIRWLLGGIAVLKKMEKGYISTHRAF